MLLVSIWMLYRVVQEFLRSRRFIRECNEKIRQCDEELRRIEEKSHRLEQFREWSKVVVPVLLLEHIERLEREGRDSEFRGPWEALPLRRAPGLTERERE
jgi:hypothetical protein